MFQLEHQWRSGKGEIAWLSKLVETFERISEPNERAVRCDAEVLSATKAHLKAYSASPGAAKAFYGSHFSLRN